ncbi:uncharacterized protein C8Q71DRAFT_723615 [Rhodofomes roseus]|uniref:Uncharacterized protein n=1 Tax=Rhodofomes roseus TaxID=34475 RepID=A0ABQ8KHP4_9APHY|nr:uncharacterized protein C8Q71DRAFT_723615 [Rhodofomes roseus]KAH9837362.1 hypothetical protein C8Q71DRAFT_723615 [Rhodofomes roseus]
MQMTDKDAPLRFRQFLLFTGEVILTVILVVASWIVNRPLGGHHLKIRRISIRRLSLHDVHYTGALYDEKYTYTFTAPCISARLHIPTPSYPCWLALTAHEVFYKSTTCDASTTRLDATCWLFPYLFKRTAGPWVSADVDGLRIRVHSSNTTPFWIGRLRQNLAGALVNGDIYRLDDVKATVRFAGLSEPGQLDGHAHSELDHAESSDGEEEQYDSDSCHGDSSDEYEDCEADGSSPVDHVDPPPPFLNRETDELRTTVSACQLHLHNPDGRIYSFRTIDAQLRRDWDTDRGSFVLIAEDSRWIRVHRPYQREWTPWWTQIFTSIVQFPFDLLRTVDYPMSTVDLYVSRADVVFDEFRRRFDVLTVFLQIRDAELVKQGFTSLREKTALFGINWGDAILDAFVKTVVAP